MSGNKGNNALFSGKEEEEEDETHREGVASFQKFPVERTGWIVRQARRRCDESSAGGGGECGGGGRGRCRGILKRA